MDDSHAALLDNYGPLALGHILNTDPDTIRARFSDTPTALDPTREQVLSALLQNERDQIPHRENEWLQRHSRMQSLSNYLGSPTETTYVDGLRRIAGGDTPVFDSITSDVPEQLLAELAWQAYPLFLIADHGPHGLGAGVDPHIAWRHPLREQFESAVQEDPTLGQVFTQFNETGGHQGYVATSTGTGGTVQLWGFADRLLGAAWHRACFAAATPSSTQFIDAALDQLRTWRSGVAGGPATVTYKMGLSGVVLDEAVGELDWQWCRIRRADERDARVIAATRLDSGHAIEATTPDGEVVGVSYAGDVVVEIDVAYQVEVMAVPEIGDDIALSLPPVAVEGFGAVARAVEAIRLGLILAGVTENGGSVVATWTTSTDPLSSILGGVSWTDPRRASHFYPNKLDAHQVDQWETWAQRVHNADTSTIATAIRRVLLAYNERHIADDVLIDSVIVWENLFGGKTEATLRVSASLAVLLGTDADDRRARRIRYRDIYNHRSAIVHGGSIGAKAARNAAQYSAEALSTAIEVLRVLFETRPELLAGSSDDRSLNLLID